MHSQNAVVFGASIYAAILSGNGSVKTDNMLLIDGISHSLGF
jgi:molecular chaperone DnaK (HSP70)